MKKRDYFKKAVLSLFLIGLLSIVIGAEGCSSSNGSKTNAPTYGVDFKVMEGMGKLSHGKEIILGDTFYVEILLENYDKEDKSGEICLRDDIDDTYGGISTICKAFTIPKAIYFEGQLQSASSMEILFPEVDEYKYENIPIDQDATLFVSLKYTQHSAVSGAIKSPEPETENNIALTQLSAPLTLSIDKTSSLKGDNSKANMKVTFTQNGNFNITSPDFKKKEIGFGIELGNYNVECKGAEDGIVSLENTKFISCSALLPREQISHPLIMTLDYGVKADKQINFKIKKE